MPNDYTGNYDVVAEFTLPAVNRVLAAMHRGTRLPHSWSLRVDDYTHIHIPLHAGAVARSMVDVFGQAIADPGVVAKMPAGGQRVSAAGAFNANLDPVVNLPASSTAVVEFSPIDFDPIDIGKIPIFAPPHLTGVAQLQMGPPTVTLAGNSITTVVAHIPVMARYVRDPDSLDIPHFLRGEFQISIGVKKVSSAAGSFIEVGLAGNVGNANLVSAWTSSPLSSQELDAINKAVRNSLTSSFQPSSTALPNNFTTMQFRTLWGAQPALAVLMDVPGGFSESPDPGSVGNVFLRDGDDFALAVRGEDITIPFAQAVNDAIAPFRQHTSENTTTISTAWGTISYTVHTWATSTLGNATVSLFGPIFGIPGGIMLVIPGHVHFWNDSSFVDAPDDFDFSIMQIFDFGLFGGDVALQVRGPLNVNLPSGLDGAIANAVRNNAQAAFNSAWNNPGLQAKIQQQVSSKLSVSTLAGFLKSMMNPTPKPGAHPVEEVDPVLFYTACEITGAGVVLHGVLQVPAWPKPHVEFAFGQSPDADDHPFPWFGPRYEYSAINSWIPGGTIREFVWNVQGGAPLHDDKNTFVYKEKDPSGIFHLCLTIKGTRITASGPAYDQAVTSTSFCGWHIRVDVQAEAVKLFARAADRPKIALTQAAAAGGLEVAGHTSPWTPAGTPPENTANLVIHFPDERSLASLEVLTRGLLESQRTDAAAAIIVVLSPDQLAKAKAADGIIFADDEAAWGQLLKVEHRPATFVIGTTGEVVWRHQGEITSGALAEALRKYLVAGGSFSPRALKSAVRMGQPTPNFRFEPAPGQEVTLRKLAGQPVALVFWRSSSLASLETLRDLQRAFANAGDQAPVVLAINDGESAETAKAAADENGLSAVVVPDPGQDISLAYGVNVWPTVILLDTQGLVSDVRYGRFSGELANFPAPARATVDAPPKKSA